MQTKRVLISFFIVTVLSLGIAGFSAAGQDEPVRDLKEYLCKDIMRLSGGDRDVAIAVLHAYLLGKKGTTRFEVQKLADATDKFMDHALEHPNDNALETMEKVTK